MENAKTKIAIVVVVAIVVVLGAALAMSMENDDNNDDGTSTVTFLIQDNVGVYFWVEGDGETVYDAFKDAVSEYNMPFEASTYEGEETGIQSLFGLEMAQDANGNWYWWSQYSYVDGAWTSNQQYMTAYDAATYSYVAIVFGDGSNAPLVQPSDAKVWDKSTDGTVFTVESPSGMYFKINGTGTTVMDAFKDATSDYGIALEVSVYEGVETGIQSMFGLAMEQDSEGNWYWWGQYFADEGKWTLSNLYMSNIQSSDHPVFLVVYNNGSEPTAPVE